MKKAILIKYKGETVFVAPLVELELKDFVSKKKEAEKTLAKKMERIENFDKAIIDLEDKLMKADKRIDDLETEIRFLKGE